MSPLERFFWTVSATLLVFQIACSPTSPTPTEGRIKVSIKDIASSAPGVQARALDALTSGNTQAVDSLTITSARVVISEIEFENSVKDTMDFEFEQPFVQDLMVGSNLHQITTVQVPFGVYEEMEIEIEKLESSDGAVFTQNPDLQNLSIRVQGFLNGDTSNTFVFTSAISAEQEMEFNPPFAIDSTNASASIVLTVDTSTWFVDNNNNPLDPTLENNRRAIERNIKASINVFKDDDDDGEKDDDDDGDGEDDD